MPGATLSPAGRLTVDRASLEAGSIPSDDGRPARPQDQVAAHEARAEREGAALAAQQAAALAEVDARLRHAALQQEQAAELLAEAALSVGRAAPIFDRSGRRDPWEGEGGRRADSATEGWGRARAAADGVGARHCTAMPTGAGWSRWAPGDVRLGGVGACLFGGGRGVNRA